jgi:hypothetical protein
MRNVLAVVSCVCISAVVLFYCTYYRSTSRQFGASSPPVKIPNNIVNPSFHSIEDIPLPEGYTRAPVSGKSFAEWPLNIPLKKLNKIYLYNHQLKKDQSSHYAVIDMSIGERDLQQCADALMRLRAEYLFSIGAVDEINFVTGDGTRLSFKELAIGQRYALRGVRLSKYYIPNEAACYTHRCLMEFLNLVFSYCSTYSLAIQTNVVQSFHDIQPGDVLVKAGSPGHAMMVGDVAINNKGKKIYLLLQSFMPAQDIHIVRNLQNEDLGPWYEADDGHQQVVTPGYTFYKTQLKRWK